jgi:hypothetical protein
MGSWIKLTLLAPPKNFGYDRFVGFLHTQNSLSALVAFPNLLRRRSTALLSRLGLSSFRPQIAQPLFKCILIAVYSVGKY